MSDLQNGGVPADDSALFADVTGGAPAPVVEQPVQPSTPAPTPDPIPEPAIPPARLREEADARRNAERERDELRGRLAAFEQQQRKPAEAAKAPDFWEAPDAYTASRISEALSPVQQQLQEQKEGFSKMLAMQVHGPQVVDGAYKAFVEAATANPGSMAAEYQSIMKSPHPYDALVSWHKRQTTLKEVGDDPAAYRTRILEEALKDPEFQKRVFEAARGQAQQSQNTITRPAVTSIPSLSNVGAVALPDDQDQASDAELFASTTRKRRA